MSAPLRSDLADRVLTERVSRVYRANPMILGATILAAALVWAILHGEIDSFMLNSWFVGITLVTIFRFMLYSLFNSRTVGKHSDRFWLHWFVALTALAGAVWGLVGTVLFPPAGSPYQLVVIVFMIATTAVGMFSLSTFFSSYAALAIPTLLPLIIVDLISGHSADLYLALTVSVFLMVALASARRNAVATARSIELQLTVSALAKENESARLAAEASSQAKSRFLANISHEIRTPMNGILGMTELLLRSGLEGRLMRHTKTLRRSCDALLSLINEILDFSKIEAGGLELEKVPFSPAETVRDTAALFGDTARQKGLSLRVSVEPAAAGTIMGDPTRLAQILNNLVANAIKFTEAGHVQIEMKSVAPQQPDESPKLVFSVSDTGIGIPSARLDHVFDAFTQADETTTRKYGGTGLGLAIAKQLTGLMGGEIGVISTSGLGSKFWFTIEALPAASATDTQPNADSTVAPKRFQGRVLLVDDNPVNIEVALGLLESFGLDVLTASSGTEAIREAVSGFDLILMDCHMPGVDGFDATKLIRLAEHEHRMSAVPIVAMTANATASCRQHCKEVGMDAYLPKPFQIQDMESILSRFLHEVPGAPGLVPATLPVFDAEPAVDVPIDMEVIAGLRSVGSSGKRDVAGGAVALYLQHSPKLLDQVIGGIERGQPMEVADAAHKWKSSSAIVGAANLAKLLAEIEETAAGGDLDKLADLKDQLKTQFETVRTALTALVDAIDRMQHQNTPVARHGAR